MNAERLTDLDAVLDALWGQLTLAVTDKTHAWRTAVLATREGDAVDARTVVLREVRKEQQQLLFYTDPRAGKVQQLLAHPQAVLVLWSPLLGWQIRLQVELSIQTQGLDVTSRWARIKMSPAAQDYLSPWPPGAVLAANNERPPVAAPQPHPEAGVFFGVVTAQVRGIDWLELHPQGHRRAFFDADGARWLQP